MHKRNLICSVLGVIVPGWGHAAQGRLKHAVLIQTSFYGALFVLALSRLIVTIPGVYLFIVIIVGLHIYSIVSGVKVPGNPTLPSRKKTWLLVGFPLPCLLMLSAVFILKPYILGIQLYKIRSVSMIPALQGEDIVLADTWHYRFNEPEVGDIVLFSLKGTNRVYVKRIMNKPDHLNQSSKNQLYVLGDNKGKSIDSRHFGLVNKENIKGKVKLRFARPVYFPQKN